MAEKLYEVFTHVDVLKSREPEYFICDKPIAIDLDEFTGNKTKDYMKTVDEMKEPEKLTVMDSESLNKKDSEGLPSGTVATVKTFVTVLEEGCRKYYDGTAPVFTPDLIEITDLFVIRCELYGSYTVGRGRTKKIAKQMAAKAMLQKLIEKESFKEFGLGKTKEEALANLESMMVDFQKRGELDSSFAENWVGKVNERCQKLKLPSAIYEIDEEGPPSQRTFIATCRIGKVNAVACGKTKKAAKTLAAQKIYGQLENWKDFAEDVENAVLAAAEQEVTNESNSAESTKKNEDLNSFDMAEETTVYPESLKKVHAAFRNGFDAQGLASNLDELIRSGDENINKVFLNKELKFMFFEPDADGDIQCVLSIDGPDGMKNVFYGFGATEMDAKDYAARNALIHLELFVRTFEPSSSSNDPSETQAKDNPPTKTKDSKTVVA